MPAANFYLDEDAFHELIRSGNWKINEIDLIEAKKIREHFGNADSFGVFASGTASPIEVGGQVGGIDWVRTEGNLRPGELPLNIYHYGIGEKGPNGYPVYHLGKNGTVGPHWANLDDLSAYLMACQENFPQTKPK